MPYSENLKRIKEEKGLTCAEISKLANLPLSTVTRVFNDKTSGASFETMDRISIGLGVSLDEIAGRKPSNDQPLTTPIVDTFNSYSELLAEKDDRIKELIEDKRVIRNEKYKVMWMLVILVTAIFTWFIVDILNGHFGIFLH